MPLVTSKEVLLKAYEGNYSVGAFNVDNLDGLQGVIDAASQLNSPVIIAFTEKSLKFMRPAYIKRIIQAATEETNIPIVLHLDHGKNFDICKTAIDAGFTSVMIDASSYDLEENIRLTKEVVDYAHPRNVSVEAELGAIAGVEDDVIVDDKYGKFTHPTDAVRLVKETNIDSLAIAIGTAHGAFKFKPGTEVKLRFDIADEVKKLLPKTPLVLHGASSVPRDRLKIFNDFGGKIPEACGVPEALLSNASKHGISKINVGSDIRICYVGMLRKMLAEKTNVIDMREFITPARAAVTEMVVERIKVFGSDGHGND